MEVLLFAEKSPIFISVKIPPANPKNYYHYSKKYKFRARALRGSMTKAENLLWQMIRRKSVHGYTFNRQRPVLHYIADFMCKELKLIIEVDGSVHDSDEQKAKDKQRDFALREVGFTILRFKNWEVLYSPNGVYNDIKDWVKGNMIKNKGTDCSSPQSPSKGEQ